MAAAGQEMSRAEPLTLLTLPQELQDIIFDYAYPGEDGVVHVSPGIWNARRIYRRTGAGLPSSRPFPELVVERFLVSKAFLKTASKAYVKNHSPINLDVLLDAHSQSILARCTAHGHAHGRWYHHISRLPTLKQLTFEIEVEDFDEAFEEDALSKTFSDAELKSLKLFGSLLEHPGLQQVTLVSTSSDSVIWSQNVKALEVLLNSTLKESALQSHERVAEALQSRCNALLGGCGKLSVADIPENGTSFARLLANHPDEVLAWIKNAKAAELARLAEEKVAEAQEHKDVESQELETPDPAIFSKHYTTVYDCEGTEASSSSVAAESKVSGKDGQGSASTVLSIQYTTVYEYESTVAPSTSSASGPVRQRGSLVLHGDHRAVESVDASMEPVEKCVLVTMNGRRRVRKAARCERGSGASTTISQPRMQGRDAIGSGMLRRDDRGDPTAPLIFLLAIYLVCTKLV